MTKEGGNRVLTTARIGYVILIVSLPLWGLLAVIPFLPMAGGRKAALAGVTFVVAEAMFWVGTIMVGKEVVKRYSDRLDPRRWFRRNRDKN